MDGLSQTQKNLEVINEQRNKNQVISGAVESVLLYNSETWTLTSALTKSLDGAYTRMLRMALNISWKQHVTNEELYGDLPKLRCKIRERSLRLAGHCFRHREEIASKLVLWQPLARNQKRGRKAINYVDTLERDTNLESTKEIENAMLDRESWRSFITLARLKIRLK